MPIPQKSKKILGELKLEPPERQRSTSQQGNVMEKEIPNKFSCLKKGDNASKSFKIVFTKISQRILAELCRIFQRTEQQSGSRQP